MPVTPAQVETSSPQARGETAKRPSNGSKAPERTDFRRPLLALRLLRWMWKRISRLLDPGSLTAASASVTGRRPTNQDRCVCVRLARGNAALLAVADGMGGYQGGEEASRIAAAQVEAILPEFAAAPGVDQARRLLPRAYEAAYRGIQLASATRSDWSEMGTTLACAAICGNQVVVANVGDSRVYHFYQSVLRQVSEDYTVLADARRNGAEESIDPRVGHALTRVLSTGGQPEIDLFPRGAGAIELAPGDTILLMSDGIHGSVSDGEMTHVLRNARSLAEAVRYLAELAIVKGSSDNVTAAGASFGRWHAGRGRLTPLPDPSESAAPGARKAPRILLAILSAAFLLLLAATIAVYRAQTRPSPTPHSVNSTPAPSKARKVKAQTGPSSTPHSAHRRPPGARHDKSVKRSPQLTVGWDNQLPQESVAPPSEQLIGRTPSDSGRYHPRRTPRRAHIAAGGHSTSAQGNSFHSPHSRRPAKNHDSTRNGNGEGGNQGIRR